MAEEIAQDTVARMCRDWKKVRRKDAPQAWAFRVAINLANSHYRRRASERRALARLQAERRPAFTELSDATAITVRQVLDELPRRQRSVLLLRFYADLSVAQVSDLLDMPEGTVKTLTSRSLTSLREAYPHALLEVSDG